MNKKMSLFSKVLLAVVLVVGMGFTNAPQAFAVAPTSTPPTISISSPIADGTYITTTSATLSGTASANSGSLSSVAYTLNNGSSITATGTTSWTINLAGLGQGLQTVVVTATQTGGGGASTSETRTFTVDSVAPTGTLTINSNATSTNSRDVTLAITATDASSVSMMNIYNGSSYSAANWESFATTKSWTIPSGESSHTVNIRFRDSQGNENSTLAAQDSIVLDTTAPTIPSHSTVNSTATSSSGATVTYTAPDSTDTVDGTLPASCTPASGSTFAIGDTTVTCTKTDAAGNIATPTTFTVTVSKMSQAITFSTLADKTFGNSDFPVSATASSGLIVSFGTTGDCTVTSGTVHLTGAGSCTITASQGGDANYNSATSVPQTFTINAPAVDETAPVIAAHGNETAVATSSSGAVVTYTAPDSTDAVDGTLSASCTPVSGSTFPIGETTVTCTKTDAALNVATPVTFTVTVSKMSQAITFDALSGKTFGNSDFSISATSDSALAVTFSSTTSSVCTVINGSTVHIVSAGDCTVRASQAGNETYSSASNVDRSFTVSKATPTLSVTNSPVIFNAGAQGATVSGSVDGVVSNISTGGSATQTDVGTYAVTADFSPTDSTNYNSLTGATAGDFIINPNPVNISSVNAIADINVANGTSIGSLGLPSTASTALSDSSSASYAVTWDGGTPTYSATTAGTYAFTGTLALSGGVNNTSSLTATVNVIVALPTYTLTYTAGTGGSFTGTSPQTVSEGSSGSAVTAVANSGYNFVNWSDSSTSNPRTDTNVTGNASFTANFEADADVTPSDLSTILTNGVLELPSSTLATDTPSVTTTQELTVSVSETGGVNTVTIPTGTIITTTSGANFDATALTAADVSAGSLSGLANNAVTDGALQWGVANLGLAFSNPITLDIYVGSAFDGQTLNIMRSTSGTNDWTNDGIVSPATCVVSAGICTFQATKASYYSAFHTTSSGRSRRRVVYPEVTATIPTITTEEIVLVTPTPASPSPETIVESTNANVAGSIDGSVLGAATFSFAKKIMKGSTGKDVTELQNRLAKEGLYSGKADGIFGMNTRKAVMAFQKKNKLKADGILGPQTRKALNAASVVVVAPKA